MGSHPRLPSTLAALLAIALAGCSDGAPGAPSTDSGATSEAGVIRGVVFDDAIRPVAGVAVTVASTALATTTDDHGQYHFSGLAPGTYFLQFTKPGYVAAQTATEVLAKQAEAPTAKVLLQRNRAATPSIDTLDHRAFITCGAAAFYTSVGCNTYPPVGAAMGDRVYFHINFTALPSWTQGELLWKPTQPAGGQMIWEIVSANNTPVGYGETANSPALAYMDTGHLKDHASSVMENGITYRIFAGPHQTCSHTPIPIDYFGCGLTINQQMNIYVHNFYNFQPNPGWRFSVDGPPQLPA